MKKLAGFLIALTVLPSAASAEDVFDAMKSKLSYLSKRQAVISHNIANSDTPNYKARDAEPFSMNIGGSLPLATTSPKHLGGLNSRGNFKTREQRDTYDTSPDGNNVILEEQLAKMSENNLEYNLTIGAMRQMGGLLRTAVGGNNR